MNLTAVNVTYIFDNLEQLKPENFECHNYDFTCFDLNLYNFCFRCPGDSVRRYIHHMHRRLYFISQTLRYNLQIGE